MHGKTDITKEDFSILCKYKNQELFKGLSVKKLELTNTVLHPTVDKIAEYIGIRQNSQTIHHYYFKTILYSNHILRAREPT